MNIRIRWKEEEMGIQQYLLDDESGMGVLRQRWLFEGIEEW